MRKLFFKLDDGVGIGFPCDFIEVRKLKKNVTLIDTGAGAVSHLQFIYQPLTYALMSITLYV